MSGAAVLYVRVSENRQIDGTSLDTQEADCRSWCASHDLTVDRVFIEKGESAKSANRTEFQAMFAYLRQLPKGRITHLIIYKFDRFSRDAEDSARYKFELRQLGIALRSITEAVDDSPMGKMTATMLSAWAQFDNEVRSERALRGMKSRLESGRWVWPAPIGYISGTKTGPSLILDSQRAHHVTRMFDLVLQGAAKAEALSLVSKHGLRTRRGGVLTGETLRRVLTNRVYIGEAFVPKWGVAMRGDWQPIVSEDVFNKVQAILEGRAPVAVAHAKDHEDFPLRGLVLCPDCQKPVTAAWSRGSSGNRFAYFRCHRAKGHLNEKAELVEAAFLGLLERLTPRQERLDLIEALLRSSWEERNAASATEALAMKQELGRLQATRQRILEQLADGVITVEDFQTLNKTTTAGIADLQTRVDMADDSMLDVDTCVGYILHLLLNTLNTWKSSDLRGKQRIQRRLFPHGICYAEKGFGTPLTHSIYTLLGDDSVDDSHLASPTRFELVLSP